MIHAQPAAREHEADVLVLGAGVAGIAFRSALPEHRTATVLEAAPEMGGLVRVHPRGPYAFDSVPHVLFFRSRRLMAWLRELLPGGVRGFPRTNSIWQHGRRIPYPYQYNAGALPDAVRRDCLDGYRDNPHHGQGTGPDATFQAWLLGQFGPGFYRHFFRPYNEKLYGLPLDQLLAAPLRWTIPGDDASAVLAGTGAGGEGAPQYYPSGREGIGRIVTALARRGRGDVVTGCAAVSIDPERRVVRTSTGSAYRYETLVSSLPLRELVRMMDPAPETVRALGESLDALPITVVGIGARASGPGLPDLWTYFPDSDVPWYRMTRLEHLSPDFAPPGGTALLLECAGTTAPSREQVVRWLDAHGVAPREAVDHFEVWHVPCAYVLFRPGYRQAREGVLRWLAERGIASIGRYGQWMYADLEMTLKSGFSAARRLGGADPAGFFAE